MKLCKNKNVYTDGFGLIEIVIITAVAGVTLFGLLQAGIVSVRLLENENDDLQATMLAQEGLEAVRAIRDESWDANIGWRTKGVAYYPVIVNGKWTLATSSPGLVDKRFNRSVILDQVFRDANDKIASIGTLDPGTLKITSRATTTTKQISLVTYITDFQSALTTQQEAKEISFEDAPTQSDLASFPSQNAGDGDPAQGFTTLGDAPQITKVELLLERATTTPSSIYAELRTSPTGIILGTSQIIDASTITSTSLTWVEFRFSDFVPLQALTKYYIRLRSVPSSTDAGSGSAGPVYWGYRQTPSSPYAGGEARRYLGRLSNANDAGQSLDQYDFGFRVYALQ